METGTDSTMSKAESHTDHPLRHWDRTCPACIAESRVQYRALFAKHEPETLKVLDSFIEVFGRDQIKNLTVFCDAYDQTEKLYGNSVW